MLFQIRLLIAFSFVKACRWMSTEYWTDSHHLAGSLRVATIPCGHAAEWACQMMWVRAVYLEASLERSPVRAALMPLEEEACMGKKEASPLQLELIQGEKKLSKRKRRLQERLKKARESKKNAEERLQRMQARLQKRSARVQRLEEKLRETRLQLQEIHTAAHAIALDIPDAESEDTTSTTLIEIDIAQEQPDNETQVIEITIDDVSGVQSVDLAALAESIVQAQDARSVAEVAEEAARVAIERAQVAENRLDQSGTARHLEAELAQMREEADRALQLAEKTEHAAREAEQVIWPLTLQDVDENEED